MALIVQLQHVFLCFKKMKFDLQSPGLKNRLSYFQFLKMFHKIFTNDLLMVCRSVTNPVRDCLYDSLLGFVYQFHLGLQHYDEDLLFGFVDRHRLLDVLQV